MSIVYGIITYKQKNKNKLLPRLMSLSSADRSNRDAYINGDENSENNKSKNGEIYI